MQVIAQMEIDLLQIGASSRKYMEIPYDWKSGRTGRQPVLARTQFTYTVDKPSGKYNKQRE